jgi:hypothetical protein
LPVGDFLFSGGGGFLFGAVAGYAIKKVIKIAAVVGLVCSRSCISIIQGMDRRKMGGNDGTGSKRYAFVYYFRIIWHYRNQVLSVLISCF